MHAGGDTLGWPLVIVGAFLLAGFVAHVVGRRAHVPRVTLLLVLGVLVGPSALDLVPHEVSRWFPVTAQLALSIVGFGLGEEFLGKKLRHSGKVVVTIALTETVVTAAVCGVSLWLVGTPPVVCFLLAGIAPATAPAATVDIVRETNAPGPLGKIVLGIAAVDDAFGILAFSVLLAAAQAFLKVGGSASVLEGLFEVGGSIVLGVLVGIPMVWLTGRAHRGTLTLIETLGCVLITSGLAHELGLSYLLANVTLGAVVANFAHHHTRPFHAIAGVSQPLLVVFFLLAGFALELDGLGEIGLFGATYFVARTVGKVVGGTLGARLAGAPAVVRRYVGWCLLPQAGVALGLALLSMQRLGGESFDLLGLLVATTFGFEVLGPISSRLALLAAGRQHQSRAEP